MEKEQADKILEVVNLFCNDNDLNRMNVWLKTALINELILTMNSMIIKENPPKSIEKIKDRGIKK